MKSPLAYQINDISGSGELKFIFRWTVMHCYKAYAYVINLNKMVYVISPETPARMSFFDQILSTLHPRFQSNFEQKSSVN